MSAAVAELADARDLKSSGSDTRTGSIPVRGTRYTVSIFGKISTVAQLSRTVILFIKRFTTKRLAELSALLSKSFLKAARVAKISSSVRILEDFTEVSQRQALILASSSFIFSYEPKNIRRPRHSR